MKKMRFVALLALMMATVMLLSSCWFGGLSVKKWIDDEAVYKATPMLSQNVEASGIPDNASLAGREGRLMYFTSLTADFPYYTVHVLYDVVENKEIAKVTESADTDYQVTLTSVTVEGEEVPYFYITETTEGRSKITLYDITGGEGVASQSECEVPADYCDLVYFDGAYYRMKKNGSLSKAFSWSVLKKRPSIEEKRGDYYYEMDEAGVVIYDLSLETVSSYTFPVNAYAAGDMLSLSVLETGNLLIQYLVPLPDTAKKYSFMVVSEEQLLKVELHTVLVKAKSGKAKEIKCDYWFLEGIESTIADDYYVGIKPASLALAVKLEKDMVINFYNYDEELFGTLVSVNKKGKVKELKQFENEKVLDVYMVAKSRFIVVTVSGREYLIDEKAEVLGEITQSTYYRDSFFICDGRIYNWSLSEKYNYRAQKYTVNTVMNNAVLFNGEDGEVLKYYDGQTTTIVAKNSNTQEFVSATSQYYILKNIADAQNVSYAVYSEAGQQLASSSRAFSFVASFEDYVLLRTYNAEGDDIYYRLSK